MQEGIHSKISAFKLSEFEVRHRDGSKLSFGKSNMNNVEAIAFQESDHDPAWIKVMWKHFKTNPKTRQVI